jgi:hypothetical protein
LGYLFAIDNLENQINFQHQPRSNSQIFCNTFEMSDTAFIKNYRLNKAVAKELIKELSPYLTDQKQPSDLDSTIMVSLNRYLLNKLY